MAKKKSPKPVPVYFVFFRTKKEEMIFKVVLVSVFLWIVISGLLFN